MNNGRVNETGQERSTAASLQSEIVCTAAPLNQVSKRLPAIKRIICETRQELTLQSGTQVPIGPIHTLQIDDSGNFYLSDEFNHSIISLDPRGNLRWALGGKGPAPGQFAYPRGIACGRLMRGDGILPCLAVADAWNRRVQFLTLDGGPLAVWRDCKGIPFGEVSDVRFLPSELKKKPSDFNEDAWLVLDRGNHRICIFDKSGKELLQIGRWLPPIISRRWALPGGFVGREFDSSRGVSEFEPLDHLHHPTRLVGNSVGTLHIWQPGSMELKRLLCGQLIPVTHCPKNLTDWISASEQGLLGWDAKSGRLLLCNPQGIIHTELAISGVPIPSNLPGHEVWLQKGNHLQRTALMQEAEGETIPYKAESGATEQSNPTTATALEESPVIRNLLRISEALVELADETLQSCDTSLPDDSIAQRLHTLSAESEGIETQVRKLMYPWSLSILRHRMAALAGEEDEIEAQVEAESRSQWHRLSERLRTQRDRLRQKGDVVLAFSRPNSMNAAGNLIPDDIRSLLSRLKNPLDSLLNIYYQFCDGSYPSDRRRG